MRKTIKFRAQDFTHRWNYGFVAKGNESAVIFPVADDGTVFLGIQIYVLPETIGQFTGLFDKNGREIYEGDIIRHSPKSDIYYIIEWHDCGLVAKKIGSSSYAGITYWINTTEVIGNIYDNPELAKGGKYGNQEM